MIELNFENLTIGQLKAMTKEMIEQHPDFVTAEELLENKQEVKIHGS